MAIDYQYKPIWDRLLKIFGNSYGVAGLMGNLFAESTLNPLCLTGTIVRTKDAKDAYIDKLKNGAISCESFSKDGVAFGIVQWRYWSRKEALYLYAKNHSLPITDIYTQIGFLGTEIQTYKTVYNTILNAKSVKEASNIIMERYEKPGNISDKAKEKRAEFGKECFDLFALENVPSPTKKYILTTADNVLLRGGPGKEYASLAKVIQKGTKYEWIATAENGWQCVVTKINNNSRALWISPDFSKEETG